MQSGSLDKSARMLKYLLGIGLSAKLSAYKKKYRNSFHSFDDENILCRISKWVGKFKVAACTNCDNPHEGGFDMSNIIWIYHSRSFSAEEEAMAHLCSEVRKAAKRHKNTTFYRLKQIEEEKEVIQKYSNGDWIETDWKGWSA
jgi:hypothetical protein